MRRIQRISKTQSLRKNLAEKLENASRWRVNRAIKAAEIARDLAFERNQTMDNQINHTRLPPNERRPVDAKAVLRTVKSATRSDVKATRKEQKAERIYKRHTAGWIGRGIRRIKGE